MTAKARFRFVFFDVDSTIATIEGIDVLGGGDPEIAALTSAAMNGSIPLDEVYGRRLERIRPTRTAVELLAERYIESTTPGTEETFETLRALGVQIHLVTGGIAQAVAPLASHLGVPPRAVHAVELKFNVNGDYAGFDERTPLTRPGGKETVIRDIRVRTKGTAALVGDGVSDLEARPAVDFFLGFGGVVVRPAVKENAEAFVEEHDLRAVLPYLVQQQPV